MQLLIGQSSKIRRDTTDRNRALFAIISKDAPAGARKRAVFGRCLFTAGAEEFRFLSLHWWIAMKTTFRAAATASRIFCLPGLVFASSDSTSPISRAISLSLFLSWFSTLGAALDVCYRAWLSSNSKFMLGAARREASGCIFFLFLFFSFVCVYYVIRYVLDYRIRNIRFAYVSVLHDLSISLPKISFVEHHVVIIQKYGMISRYDLFFLNLRWIWLVLALNTWSNLLLLIRILYAQTWKSII